MRINYLLPLLALTITLSLAFAVACDDDDDDDGGGIAGGGWNCAEGCGFVYDECGLNVVNFDGDPLLESECVAFCLEQGGIDACAAACLDQQNCATILNCIYDCR